MDEANRHLIDLMNTYTSFTLDKKNMMADVDLKTDLHSGIEG